MLGRIRASIWWAERGFATQLRCFDSFAECMFECWCKET